jgi:hypothetical protein
MKHFIQMDEIHRYIGYAWLLIVSNTNLSLLGKGQERYHRDLYSGLD